MGFKLSAGLGLALLLLAGSFKMYYDKTQAEIESFHLQLEQSIQNQKMLEGTIEQQNENLKQTVENHELMISQVERLQKENDSTDMVDYGSNSNRVTLCIYINWRDHTDF